ncbi:MAG: site-2 protease family protein [Vicinamibacteria bacterium]
MTTTPPAPPGRCPQCGSEIAPGLRECPGCHRLVYAEELRSLAAEAESAQADGDVGRALEAWRRALHLLPVDSRQHATIAARVTALADSLQSQGAGAPPAGSRWARWLAPLGAFGLFLWKIKFVVALVLTKGKLLLLGLLKAPTLFSALAFLGVYWSLYGWRFALGVVAAIYVHEIGHVYALSRYGIRASAPMFVPGLGAYVRHELISDPRQDARVAIAGPIWGLGASLAAAAVALATRSPLWGAIAHFSAWLNLANLIPIVLLDGGRAFGSLSRTERWIAAAAFGATWWATHEVLVAVLAIACAARAAFTDGTTGGDREGLVRYIGVGVVLETLAQFMHAAFPP